MWWRNNIANPTSGLAREIAALYAPCGLWQQYYARFRVALARFDQVEQYLPREGCVLDLGCGYGVLANYLALAAPNRLVIGIDMSERRIALARRTINGRTNLSFVTGDVTRVGLPDSEAMILSDFMHHLPIAAQESLLARLYVALRRNGLLLIQEVNMQPRWKYRLSQLSDLILYPFEDKLHFRSPEDWTSSLKKNGFRDIQVIPGDAGTLFARVSYTAHK